MRIRRHFSILLSPILLISLSACDSRQAEVDSHSTYVRTVVHLPGEDELLRMEEERWNGNGRLRTLLVDSNAKTRRRAAIALGRVGDRGLEPELKRLLADREAEVRAAAAWAAGQLGDTGLAPDLEALFADPDATVRRDALVARSVLGGATPPGLAALLTPTPADDASRDSLGAAIIAAGRFDDPALSPLLVALLGHGDPEIRWRAAYSLYRHGREGDALSQALRDPDPRVRSYAALGLGSAGQTAAVPDLIALLGDPSNDVSAAAATALGRLRDGRAVDALAELGRSPVPRRRFAAIHALADGGISSGALVELFSDPSPWVRAIAVDGLRRMRATGPVIAKATRDPEWQVRAAAARARADSGDITALAQTLQYDADARVVPAVLEGLSRLKYRGLDTLLLKHLSDKDPMVRATAARLVGGRHVETAVDALTHSWELSKTDEILDARLAILDSLAMEGGTERVLNVLKLGAGDSNRLVRAHAWALLERLNATAGVELVGRTASLKTDNYYRDLAEAGDYEYHASFETEKGTIEFRLFPKEAPVTVRFLDEVASSFYFDDKVVTWMDPPFELGDGDDRGDGHGSLGRWAPDEAHDRPFDKVHLALARPLGRDSGSSQFRITLLPRPDLEGVATNVGELIKGGEVLDQLELGTAIKKVTVTKKEFKGKYEDRKVEVPVGGTTPAPGEAAPIEEPGAWKRPPSILYMSIVGGVMLVLSLLPLLVSAEKREDFPAALGLVVLLILIVAGAYTWLVFQGDYFAFLTSPRPGPRILDRPNPPVMSRDDAELACEGAMAWVMLNLALLWFLVNGRPFARWLFLFLSLIEIAAFTAQISTKLPLLYVLSQVGIGINLLKIWFLLMDRQTKEYLSP